MGWLRLVGSLKLHVSFAKYNLFCRALLQKRPMILRSLLIVATPYSDVNIFMTTPVKFLPPRNPPNPQKLNSSVQIQIKPKSEFEFVPRDLENLSLSLWWIEGCSNFKGNCHDQNQFFPR